MSVKISPVKLKEQEVFNKQSSVHKLNNSDLFYNDRVKKTFSVRETFNLDLGYMKDNENKEIPKDKNVEGYAQPTKHTPKVDPDYIFPQDDTIAILLAMYGKDPTLLVGSTGVGKTSLLEQIGARLNYSVVKISFDGAVSRNDLVGEWVVKGKEMTFQYGIIPVAFRMPGTIIILDEWDTQNEDTAFVLQRPLQKEDRKLFLLETLETIPIHEDNFLAATANTNGQGDDSGLYSQGTRVQSYAQLNRFSITVRLDYLKAADEISLLKKRYSDLEEAEIVKFVEAINKIRDGYSNGQLSVPLSTRDLINWADKYISYGNGMIAAKYCFLNRMNIEDAKVCEGIIQRVFAG